MRIGFITSNDPRDRRSWSGTHYYMAQALQRHCGDVAYLGPIRPMLKPVAGGFAKAIQILLKKRYYHSQSILVAKRYAKILQQRISEQTLDWLVAPLASAEISFLETELPIVYVSDSTFALLLGYYPAFSRLLGTSIREGHTLEGLAINKADLILYPSEWAAKSAVTDYHADRTKIHIVPFGANLEDAPPEEAIMDKRKSDRCRLLFLGRDWERKGGEIAFETLLALEEMGIQSELIVCGVVPPRHFSHRGLTVIPFLNKSDEIQRKRLYDLLLTSDFLLLPTRAECFGMVFCEASAFGLPAITTNTGGLPGVIENGKNGFMLPLDARGLDYAKVISGVYRDDRYYRELTRSSRAAFNQKLNWDAWALSAKRLMQESNIVRRRRTR